jgi:5-formyltetrahydrofolate cyclo-ligase
MTAPALTRAQQEIGRRLLALPEVLGADVVAAYAAMAGEVSLDEPLDRLCTMNKLLLLPRFAAARHEYEMAVVGTLGADTVPGSFGIREPRPDAAVATDSQWNGSATVWLIPGLAFDRFGTRLGRGGGFYDRLLARTQGPRIGIALEAQLSADPLPRETHDLPVHMIVTERRVLRVT